VTWEDVVRIGLGLLGVELSSAYGTEALRVNGKFLCRERDDRTVLAIRCDLEERPYLVEANPDTLFVTPHYQDYPMVLVTLAKADRQLVQELVEDAWVEKAPKRMVKAYLAERGG